MQTYQMIKELRCKSLLENRDPARVPGSLNATAVLREGSSKAASMIDEDLMDCDEDATKLDVMPESVTCRPLTGLMARLPLEVVSGIWSPSVWNSVSCWHACKRN